MSTGEHPKQRRGACARGGGGGRCASPEQAIGPDSVDRRAPRRLASVPIVCAPGSDVESLLEAGGGPRAPGRRPLPGLRRQARTLGLLCALGAPPRGAVPAACPARALPPLPADPRALAELPLRAPARPRGGDRGTALRLAAEGRGHRAAADALSVPETTARSWLRRLRRRADPLRARFAWLAAGARPRARQGAALERPAPLTDRRNRVGPRGRPRARRGRRGWGRCGRFPPHRAGRAARQHGRALPGLSGRGQGGARTATAEKEAGDAGLARAGGALPLRGDPPGGLKQAADLRREAPGRAAAQIAETLARLHGEQAPSARTVRRHLARLGLRPAGARRRGLRL
jgi:hypothetical protein